MPAAAAARSFERTASIRWPRLERRTFATSRARRIAAARTRKPKTGLGILSSSPLKTRGKKVEPPISGCVTGEPVARHPSAR